MRILFIGDIVGRRYTLGFADLYDVIGNNLATVKLNKIKHDLSSNTFALVGQKPILGRDFRNRTTGFVFDPFALDLLPQCGARRELDLVPSGRKRRDRGRRP